jgi:hypothetical protein
MDAAEATPPDESMMKMYGRGLAGYPNDEVNAANRAARRQRVKPTEAS